MLAFIVSLSLAYLLGLIQFQSIVVLFGVKANLLLALGVSYGLIESNWLRRAFLALSVMGIISFYIIPDLTILILGVSILFSYALIDYLPWKKQINAAVAVILATLAINADFVQISGIMVNLVLNVAALFAVYALIKYIDGKLNPYRYL